MDWFNNDLRREIYLGEKRAAHTNFVMLEDEDDKTSTVKQGDTDIPDFDRKFTEGEIR